MAFLAAFALCLLAFHLTACKPVYFKDCGSKMSNLTEVDIVPCLTEPCKLKRGAEESVQVTFIPNAKISAAHTVVHGIVGGIPVPFPVAQPDPCKGHGITCPMVAGEKYTFKTTLPIKSAYPPVQVVVKWEMVSNTNEDVYCWEVSAIIV